MAKPKLKRILYDEDLRDIALFQTDPAGLFGSNIIQQLDSNDFNMILKTLEFLVKPHSIFPVLTLQSAHGTSYSREYLQNVFIGLRNLFNCVFKPDFVNRKDFVGNFPGWSLSLNLQRFLGANEPSQAWEANSDLLEFNEEVFGFIYLQPWVFYSYVTNTVSTIEAKNWLENYRISGKIFTPL